MTSRSYPAVLKLIQELYGLTRIDLVVHGIQAAVNLRVMQAADTVTVVHRCLPALGARTQSAETDPSVIVARDEPTAAQQVEGGRIGIREQCGERQSAPRSAELLRSMDG